MRRLSPLIVLSLSLACRCLAAADDDLLFLEPAGGKPTPKAEASPSSIPTENPEPTATPGQAAKARKAVVQAASRLDSVHYSRLPDAVKVWVQGRGKLSASVRVLHAPERLWLRFPKARLAAPAKVEIGAGPVRRVRLSQKAAETQMVLDLDRPLRYSLLKTGPGVFGLRLETGPLGEEVQESPAQGSGRPPQGSQGAVPPKVDMMLFDRNVMYQGKQYEAYPCANLVYDRADAFPLEREFQTSFVFYGGYGAFVCNLRLVDPSGSKVDETREPFAFNLYNRLADSHVDYTWKVRFHEKGTYKVVVTLNGEDVYSRSFYVGHSGDKP
jgi:hypothetical protein